jgi:hypothetical protein
MTASLIIPKKVKERSLRAEENEEERVWSPWGKRKAKKSKPLTAQDRFNAIRAVSRLRPDGIVVWGLVDLDGIVRGRDGRLHYRSRSDALRNRPR